LAEKWVKSTTTTNNNNVPGFINHAYIPKELSVTLIGEDSLIVMAGTEWYSIYSILAIIMSCPPLSSLL
jgi:hypothetical protein